MKIKKKYFIIIIILIILSFCIPIRNGEGRWIDDSEIYDVGHYSTNYYNIYGIKIWEK